MRHCGAQPALPTKRLSLRFQLETVGSLQNFAGFFILRVNFSCFYVIIHKAKKYIFVYNDLLRYS